MKVKVKIADGKPTVTGRVYSDEALKSIAEQAPSTLVFDRVGIARGARLRDAVGFVKDAELEDGEVRVSVTGIAGTESSRFLEKQLEDGKARLFMFGIGVPEYIDGVPTVGPGFVLKGVGIAPVMEEHEVQLRTIRAEAEQRAERQERRNKIIMVLMFALGLAISVLSWWLFRT